MSFGANSNENRLCFFPYSKPVLHYLLNSVCAKAVYRAQRHLPICGLKLQGQLAGDRMPALFKGSILLSESILELQLDVPV